MLSESNSDSHQSSGSEEERKELTEQQKMDILSLIHTVFLKESEVAQKIEILSVQIGVLEEALNTPDVFNKERLQEDYLERLGLLETDLVEGRRVLLKYRDAVFKNNQYINLTNENRREFLEEFRVELSIQLQPYRQFLVFELVDLPGRLEDLRKELASLKKEFETILDNKTQLTSLLHGYGWEDTAKQPKETGEFELKNQLRNAQMALEEDEMEPGLSPPDKKFLGVAAVPAISSSSSSLTFLSSGSSPASPSSSAYPSSSYSPSSSSAVGSSHSTSVVSSSSSPSLTSASVESGAALRAINPRST